TRDHRRWHQSCYDSSTTNLWHWTFAGASMSNLNYTTYVNQITNLMVQVSSDVNFATFLPGCIDYAEQRMYRELDLLATRVTDSSASTSTNNREFLLPTAVGTFLVVESINIISPAGATAANGNRNQLVETSREFVDAAYPSNLNYSGVPAFFAMKDNATVIF